VFPAGGLAHLFFAGLVAALAAGLAALDRKGALQLMLSRPLVLGPVLGWALGDAQGGLTIGVPLELLFLGGVNLGGSLPENETLLAGAMTTAAVLAGEAAGTGVDPPLAALALLLLFPLALVGRRLESRTEQRNNAFFELAWATVEEDPDPFLLNLRGLLLPFVATAAICFAAAFFSPLLAAARSACSARLAQALTGSWHAVWALAAATAIRAVRDRRAPVFAAASFAITLVFVFLVSDGR
jgi:mannose/fructose/N-acetylgalactosamine-specific phosphotransferase system component IIC